MVAEMESPNRTCWAVFVLPERTAKETRAKASGCVGGDALRLDRPSGRRSHSMAILTCPHEHQGSRAPHASVASTRSSRRPVSSQERSTSLPGT